MVIGSISSAWPVLPSCFSIHPHIHPWTFYFSFKSPVLGFWFTKTQPFTPQDHSSVNRPAGFRTRGTVVENCGEAAQCCPGFDFYTSLALKRHVFKWQESAEVRVCAAEGTLWLDPELLAGPTINTHTHTHPWSNCVVLISLLSFSSFLIFSLEELVLTFTDSDITAALLNANMSFLLPLEHFVE